MQGTEHEIFTLATAAIRDFQLPVNMLKAVALHCIALHAHFLCNGQSSQLIKVY
jgi:hypothetical protein